MTNNNFDQFMDRLSFDLSTLTPTQFVLLAGAFLIAYAIIDWVRN